MRKTIAVGGMALTFMGTGTLAAASKNDLAAIAGAEPILVQVKEMAVPIVDGDRLDGALHVTMVLAAADSAAGERVTASLPRLRSASLSALLEFSRLHASPMRPVNAERLSADLTEALQKVEPGVSGALIVNVAARPA